MEPTRISCDWRSKTITTLRNEKVTTKRINFNDHENEKELFLEAFLIENHTLITSNRNQDTTITYQQYLLTETETTYEAFKGKRWDDGIHRCFTLEGKNKLKITPHPNQLVTLTTEIFDFSAFLKLLKNSIPTNETEYQKCLLY